MLAVSMQLRESGYVEGQNVAIEHRSAENRPDALPRLTRELVARVSLIATSDTASALAAKAATTTIPIVFVNRSNKFPSSLLLKTPNTRNSSFSTQETCPII
jgi:putative ABC transport system substrate-binding protein